MQIHRLARSALILFFLVSIIGVDKTLSFEGPASTATVVYTEGYVDVKYSQTDLFVQLEDGKTITTGDTIQTGDEGVVELLLPDKSLVRIGPSSMVVVRELGNIEVTKVPTGTFELVKGKIRALVKPFVSHEPTFIIKTYNSTIGVRGTDFGVTYDRDGDITHVLGLMGCVAVASAAFPDTVIAVCRGKEIWIIKDRRPEEPADIPSEELIQFIEDMEFETGQETPLQDNEGTPYITGMFLNRDINLEDVDGILSLCRDDLSIDGTILISGTAAADIGRVILVMVSLDGGMTWSNASGTESWSFSFVPTTYTESELMVKAVSDSGAVSDPRDFDPVIITFQNVGSEDIMISFCEALFGGVRAGDVSGIRDLVSDGYDGGMGRYYTKDELIDDGFFTVLDNFGTATFKYTLDRTNMVGDRIVGVTRWTVSSAGTTTQSGTTTWWLSKTDDDRLVHTEGGWPFAMTLVLPVGIYMEEIDSESPWPCHKSVKLLVTAPNIPANVPSITVEVYTYSPASPVHYTLTRAYYEDCTGLSVGFGGEVILQYSNPPPLPPYCSNNRYGDPSYDYISCSFTGYEYNFWMNGTLVP